MDFRDTEGTGENMATDAIEATAPAKPKKAEKRDSKAIAPQPYALEVDHSRDALLTDFGKDTLKDRYLLPGELYQDLFVRVASAYADDARARAAPLRLYLATVVHARDPRTVERRHRARPADFVLPQLGPRQPQRHRRYLERECLAGVARRRDRHLLGQRPRHRRAGRPQRQDQRDHPVRPRDGLA